MGWPAWDQLDYWAVLLAALASFILGALWYAPPVFGRVWMTATGLNAESLAARSTGAVFAGAYGLSASGALLLCLLLPADAGWWSGLRVGGVFAGGLIASALGMIYLFERKPLELYLINAGFQVCAFALSGAIIGAWR